MSEYIKDGKCSKVSTVLTLSAYLTGEHISNGATPKAISELIGYGGAHASFKGGMPPIFEMIESFENVPTGTKIRVTMEVV